MGIPSCVPLVRSPRRRAATVRQHALLFAAALAIPGAVASLPVLAAPDSQPVPEATAATILVHYHRFEQDYQDASLWTWDERLVRSPSKNELLPVRTDDFGLIFQFDPSLYGKPGDRIGLLPRKNRDWQFKDGPDRFWQPSLGSEIYIVQGQPGVHAKRPDVRPRLADATLDGDRLVTARFTHRLPVAEWPASRFKLTTRVGRPLPMTSVTPIDPRDGRTAQFALAIGEDLELRQDLLVLAEGMAPTAVQPGRILQDPGKFCDPDAQLGATYTPTATTFRVFAPTAERIWVVTAQACEGPAGRNETAMERNHRGIWEASVTGNLAGKYYAYRLEGALMDSQAEVTDIYATCTQNRAVRSLIVDLREVDPAGFRDRSFTFSGTPADAVIYEMHVRDFTISPDSGAAHKGKYLGLTESGTRLTSHEPPGSESPGRGPRSITTGLDHLVELGVTHVQLMPIEDFDNDEARQDPYSWGYMTASFNSPDGWYATNPMGPSRVREFKQAVKSLHDRGIGVVMDVVYNHTADRAGFQRFVPDYYYRHNADGSLSNGSGCGNEFMSESPMARKFILDSLKYWVREYQVDGFRFDLMGLIDMATMKRVKAELSAIKPGILIYGEPWTGGATPLSPITDHSHIRGTGIGAFNDHFRDAIKGDRDGGLPGFVQVGDRAWGIRLGLEGAIHDWSADPAESINYFEAHDNLTAWDKMLQSMPNATDAQRRQAMRFGSLILLTSQGTVFMQAGQEFCRSKQGHSNSYNLPDGINQIDWSLKRKNKDMYEYVRGLIAIRKAHPVLRLAKRSDIETRSFFFNPPNDRCFTWRLKGEGLPGEPAREILVLLNGGAQPAGFVLPVRGWKVLADGERAGLDPIREVDDGVQLPARSGMLLVR